MTPDTQGTAVPPPARRSRKVLLSLLIVGLLGGAAAMGTYSAFTATTTNDNNQIASGTVAIGDSFSSPLYDITGAKPGSTQTNCTTITYSGSLTAQVKMYISTTLPGSGAGEWKLEIESVTGATSDADCAAGNGTGTVLNTGDQDLYGWWSAHGSWANGLALTPEGGGSWTNGKTVRLRVKVTQNDSGGSGGASTGLHTYTFEAQST